MSAGHRELGDLRGDLRALFTPSIEVELPETTPFLTRFRKHIFDFFKSEEILAVFAGMLAGFLGGGGLGPQIASWLFDNPGRNTVIFVSVVVGAAVGVMTTSVLTAAFRARGNGRTLPPPSRDQIRPNFDDALARASRSIAIRLADSSLPPGAGYRYQELLDRAGMRVRE